MLTSCLVRLQGPSLRSCAASGAYMRDASRWSIGLLSRQGWFKPSLAYQISTAPRATSDFLFVVQGQLPEEWEGSYPFGASHGGFNSRTCNKVK